MICSWFMAPWGFKVFIIFGCYNDRHLVCVMDKSTWSHCNSEHDKILAPNAFIPLLSFTEAGTDTKQSQRSFMNYRYEAEAMWTTDTQDRTLLLMRRCHCCPHGRCYLCRFMMEISHSQRVKEVAQVTLRLKCGNNIQKCSFQLFVLLYYESIHIINESINFVNNTALMVFSCVFVISTRTTKTHYSLIRCSQF